MAAAAEASAVDRDEVRGCYVGNGAATAVAAAARWSKTGRRQKAQRAEEFLESAPAFSQPGGGNVAGSGAAAADVEDEDAV